MDDDAKTCGKCKHGNFYDSCAKCEDEAENIRLNYLEKGKPCTQKG